VKEYVWDSIFKNKPIQNMFKNKCHLEALQSNAVEICSVT